MPLCFIEPQDAIRVIAESVGREARRQLVGEVVRAWVDDIPDQELSVHYAKAIADLDEDDLHLLAAWHASLEVGQPVPNTEFLVAVFPSLGENRREALKIAAGFRGEEAFQEGVSEQQALETVLPMLSRERALELALGSACSSTCGIASAARTSEPAGGDPTAWRSLPATAATSLGSAGDYTGRNGRARERRGRACARTRRRCRAPWARALVAPGQPRGSRGGRARDDDHHRRRRDGCALELKIDPELGLDFVELGLIYGVEIDGGNVHVTFTLTTPGCPIGPQVTEQIEEFVVKSTASGTLESEMVFTPPWSPELMTEDAKFALGY